MTGRPWADLAVTLADGTPGHTAALMHDGRALLLDLGAGGAATSRVAPLADRVQAMQARRARRPRRCADPPRRLRRHWHASTAVSHGAVLRERLLAGNVRE